MLNNKWTFNESTDDVWTYELYDTKEQAIAAGRNNLDSSEYEHFYVGRSTTEGFGVSVDAEGILETIGENMYDEVGEVAEDYLQDVTKEHNDILGKELTKVLMKWMKEFGYEPKFYKITDTELVENGEAVDE